jgi:hypothetical protein
MDAFAEPWFTPLWRLPTSRRHGVGQTDEQEKDTESRGEDTSNGALILRRPHELATWSS